MASLFMLRFPRNTPWGDYGHILLNGIFAGKMGNVSVKRVGPYVPPFTFGIGQVVVTDEVKRDIEAARFTGTSFNPVVKEHVVKMDWSAWDRTRDLPPVMPRDGEPEHYVLDGPHDEELARAIGDLWELVVPDVAAAFRSTRTGFEYQYEVSNLPPHPDFFRVPPHRGVLVSARAAEWLAAHYPESLKLVEVPVT